MADAYTFEDFAADDLDSKIYVSDGVLTINISYEYHIPVATLTSEARILSWVHQLSEKTWMTVPAMRYFIELATRTAGITLQH